MRYLIALSVLVAALAAPAVAPAGGWASVELAGMPTGIDAGDAWTARFTVLRHGVTPTDGAEPSLTIVHPESSETTTFPAAPAGATGVYEAEVVFPEAGTWMFEIDNGLVATGDGLSSTTRFDPVTIGAADGGVGDGGGLISPLPLGGLVLLLALVLVAVFGARRLRRLAPAGR
jgi:YtkA-like protein